MKKKIIIISTSFVLLLIIGIVLTPYTLNKQDGFLWHVKQIIPEPIKILIKNNLFKDKLDLKKYEDIERAFIKLNNDIFILNVSNELQLSKEQKIISYKKKDYKLKKFNLPFGMQHAHRGKPSGYLDLFGDYLIIASGRADFIFISKDDLENKKISFKNLESNFKEIVKHKNFYIPGNQGLRDLKIIDDFIFLTYPKPITDTSGKSCVTLGILSAKINFNFLKFEEFFSLKNCPARGSWGSTRSGGRIEGDEKKLFLTVGDFGDMIPNPTSQNLKTNYGKIISINRNTKNAEIVSMGHRNPQGLLYDRNKDFLISSEHGPDGGDEINLIDLNDEAVENFGWPISSYGEHYKSTLKGHHDTNTFPDIKKYAPLFKSHTKYGFKEPMKNWTPSIGISQIDFKNIQPNKKRIYISSLGNNIPEGDMTIHIYEFTSDYKNVLYEDRIIIGERIRDIILAKEDREKIFLILESTPSLGILSVIEK